jgi:hypothetical protein
MVHLNDKNTNLASRSPSPSRAQPKIGTELIMTSEEGWRIFRDIEKGQKLTHREILDSLAAPKPSYLICSGGGSAKAVAASNKHNFSIRFVLDYWS